MSISSETTMQAYQLNKGGTRARMAILRMIAADSVRNRNEATRLKQGDWRGARNWTMKNWRDAYMAGLHHGKNGGVSVWVTHQGEYFRNERDYSEVMSGSHHTGYYTDSDCCDELAIGIVASLPHGRFIAGYRWTSNDERVYFPEVFDDETDAARMSDEHARVFAEQCREYIEPEENEEPQDLAPRMRELASQMHALAGDLFDTEVDTDIMHRLTALADDMQQVAEGV